ncbi:MAG: hypothetical protein ABIH71_03835 [Candidatus Omnitrophota bacterium]|nr:hypothetical protein [Candidatus Omnitrophota bacterium]
MSPKTVLARNSIIIKAKDLAAQPIKSASRAALHPDIKTAQKRFLSSLYNAKGDQERI